MIETCCQFGAHGQLAGISTEPSGASRRIANLLISAGLIPKFGPYRLYAEWARRLAGLGFRSLRFDLGDIGDSRQAHAGLTLEKRTQLEIGAAIDHLAHSRELDGVVLGGLCSGAEDAFRYAEHDPRVVAVVLIDPFSYRTQGWAWRHALHRLKRRSMRLLGMFESIEGDSVGVGNADAAAATRLSYKHIDHAESSRILRRLIARGVRVHFIYTGGSRDSFNHRGQLQAMFCDIDFKGLVSVDYLHFIDHTQALQADRDCLIDTIARRLASPITTRQ